MKKAIRTALAAILLSAVLITAVSCKHGNDPTTDPGTETVDYASEVKLDMSSPTLKQVVSVRTYVDGDTTHFNLTDAIDGSSVLKARYLAINTPESTGKIEEYGKRASVFTKEKLSGAVSIIVESDDGNWNLDSTGSRHLVWVWYKPSADADYRNLNIEILQNGLAVASNAAGNRYGDVCMKAIAQAKAEKLCIYSGQKDPDFYYGDAIELTLRELRVNIDTYNNVKVAFEGVVTACYNNSVYVEDYDPELDMYFGMSVYYGFNLAGDGLDALSVGNRTRIVGTVQYYEAGETYQVSGLTYRIMKPDDPNNIRKISDGHSAAYMPVTAEQFAEGKVTVEVGDENKVFDFPALAMGSSVSLENLYVNSVSTTDSDSSSNGAMTLHCESEGFSVEVRTIPLVDATGSLITADEYLHKTIDVKGFVDYYGGSYQVKVLVPDSITVCE